MAMDRMAAQEILFRLKLSHRPDFHILPASKVDDLIEAADLVRYRKPRNANGSRARYFYAMLLRRTVNNA
jgi:hypothetical protein